MKKIHPSAKKSFYAVQQEGMAVLKAECLLRFWPLDTTAELGINSLG
jgi:hypothetical protein